MARIPTRNRPVRLALAAALVAVGCSGGSGGCGSSCGGAFKTKDDQGNPIVFTGTRLSNVAQVRVTRSGLAFLNAEHLNDVITQLNNSTGGLQIKCIDAGQIFSACGILGFIDITRVHLLAGDEQLTGDPAKCTGDPAQGIVQEPGTPLHIQFKDVSLTPDPADDALHVHLVMHLKTGDMYLRTVEEHSDLCGSTSAIQARVKYDDLLPGLPPQDQYTAADLSIRFSTAPDGRLEFDFDDASLANFVDNFHAAALVLDGNVGNDPAPPASAAYNGDGCDSGTGTYSTMDSSTSLRCAGVFDVLNAGCDVTQQNGGACAIVQYVRGVLFDAIKNAFRTQIVTVLRTQLDNLRCQRSTNSQGSAVACDPTHACPNDDDGNPLVCDSGRGVCRPQNDRSTDPYDCEPIPLGVTGQLDVSDLTSKVGFPPGTRLNVFAGLGSKGGGAKVDSTGVQVSAEAGTQTPSVEIAPCVPSASPPAEVAVPPMDFDAASNKPPGVVNYDFGFSLASAMLNRGFYDAYDAGMLCIAVTNVTSSFISSGLFKTFLPSINLITGGRDVPMKILLRPTVPPFVRIGKNTTRKDAVGNDIPDDPLISLSFNKMNLDFYLLVDERQVRIFTLQADVNLPLDLRPDPNDNSSLVPVMGGLDTVLANVSALSSDYNPDATATNGKPVQVPYTPGSDMLAEDPGMVKDLLGAAVRLAQPLLAGVIKPIALPSMFGLKFEVRGVAGAVPMADVVNDGFQHLAIWAQVGVCGTTGVNCERYSVRTEARVVEKYLPASLRDVQGGARPSITLDLSARTAASARAQFTYRVDGSLWSPWLSQERLTITDPLFLVQGHHTIEIAAREAGDDSTADRRPVAIDFFVSYEAPTVTLTQRPDDGALVTRAHSASTPASRLTYSYRIDGQQTWTEPGPARVFTQDELDGHGLTVSVTDDAGHSAQAHFGEEEGLVLARAGVTGGCASSGYGVWALLGLVALVARRQRKGSISAG